MNRKDEFLKTQKILHLTTIGSKNIPHIVPVWYLYSSKKIYIGTNTKTKKAQNVNKNNKVAFCVDVGVNSPIFGVMGQGNANIILENNKVKKIAKKILARYFKSLQNKSAVELLDNTDCIIEIIPEKFSIWSY
ncbi:pyridoxamine 5'-phosphate oxidase family protein [Nitrosarchaeum koreense]|uniref:Pyridoxamine 5'-phosphate oxidase-related FMN-binding protein n=1 Tax=Nitrosarchaeum koreense MY1 TaxID=1001994 RepID=F9CYU1_9ARCH|nr:pyridoxamine 5'-phosphate oxidase family protein [Nitrosarchaeum koreense]EGP92909.1 Pyridoxamine 5'-phosphate oxidase-related FMN-binding protein [Nitrosarchaeum koreense MY1]